MIKYQCSGWLKYKKGSSDLRGFTYTYDASGNITKIVTEGTNVPQAALTKEYTYDALGQLATETNGGASRAYAYDTVGNIRSVTTDGAVIKSFGYTNPSWPDLLTSVTVGGTTKDILYEGQTQTSGVPSSGNPVTYYNGKDYSFTWTKGRQLTSATVDGEQVSYTYDMSGVRSNKQVGDTTYTYTTLSGKVMRQTWGDNNALEFVYDDGNQPFAVIYKHGQTTELYYYVLNAQGDVSAILDSGGKIAASYDYDAWGNCTVYDSSDAAIGDINPLRYRGYYYDAETGFYYLQSRYYDFANCRFINADGVVTTNVAEFLECNMFAYCTNNPINFSDEDGKCYYANGVWTHDAWENIGGYEKKPEPKGVTGTYGSVSAAWGIAGSVSVARVTDSRGNEALAITAGFGGGLGGSFSIDAAQKEFKAGDPGSSLGVVYYPDASVVWDLQGWGVAVGGTCILVSGEVSSSTINGYSIAPAFGADFHALITYTWVVPINDRSRKGR